GHCRVLLTLAISDVPGGLELLASGPTAADDTTLDDCKALISRFKLADAVPPALRARLQAADLPPSASTSHPAFRRSEIWKLLDNAHARFHLRAAASQHGLHVEIDDSIDDQPFDSTAEHLLDRLRRIKQEHG